MCPHDLPSSGHHSCPKCASQNPKLQIESCLSQMYRMSCTPCNLDMVPESTWYSTPTWPKHAMDYQLIPSHCLHAPPPVKVIRTSSWARVACQSLKSQRLSLNHRMWFTGLKVPGCVKLQKCSSLYAHGP